MTPQRFWEIIDAAAHVPDAERFEALKRELMRLPPQEILAFEKQYDDFIDAAYKTDLWGAGYLINGGCSDDGFHYFRTWLVSCGKRVYEKALVSPDSLADVLSAEDADGFCESNLDCAAARAWEEKTGRSDEEFYKELAQLGGPGDRGQDLEGEDWDFEDDEEVRRRLPRLSRLFLPEGD